MSDLPLRVSAPASSANLGPLFDVAALALELRNELEVRPGSGRVIVEGTGAGSLPTDHTNLVARAFALVAPDLLGAVDLHCTNRVPTARGLGSSTAAAACGLVAGAAALGRDLDAGWLARELTALDGHPDNAAACAHGGLVLVPPGDHGLAQPVRLPLPAGIEFVAVIPAREVPTAQARTVLADSIPRERAVQQLDAAAAVVAALAAGAFDEPWLRDALHGDHLHEGPRGQLVPELGLVRGVLAAAGDRAAIGATLSGAGPTVLAWCRPGQGARVRDLLASACAGADVVGVAPAGAGARIEHAG